MRGLTAAVRFLTRIPVPGAATTAEDLPRAVPWFPLMGALINALVALIGWGALAWWPLPVAVVLAVVAGLVLTGGFHEDAAADSADALGGGWDKDRVLAILKDSRIGAYGGMALWVVLSLRAVLLAALLPLGWAGVLGYAIAGAWGRWTVAPCLVLLPPLAPGLAKDIAGAGRRGLPWATLLALLVTALLPWPQALVVVLVAVLTTLAWIGYLARRLGGQTGDLLGAGNLLVEAVILLVLGARP